MERSTGEYMYPGYDGPLSEDGNTNRNNPNLPTNILENFPYLQHGINFGSKPQTSSASLAPASSNTIDYKITSSQQTLPQIAGSHVPGVRVIPTFQSLVGSSQLTQGALPGVSTFTTTLPQTTLPSNYHTNTTTSAACDIEGVTINYPRGDYQFNPARDITSASQSNNRHDPQTGPLPGFQNLVSMSSASTDPQQGSLYSRTYKGSVLHSREHDSKSALQFGEPRSIPTVPSNTSTSQAHSGHTQVPVSNSNFYNLVNHAVKMSPVQIAHENKENRKTIVEDRNSYPSPVNSGKHAHGFSGAKEPPTVKFFLKGKLYKKAPLKPKIPLPDALDFGEGYEDSNAPVINIKSEPSSSPTKSATQNDENEQIFIKEPSLAEIRASIDKLDNSKDSTIKTILNSDDIIKVEHTDINDPALSQSFSLGGEGMNESWYSSALKRFGELVKEEDPNHVELCAKKGGRSDPDNPFAITSPSFSASAARALMTTSNSATATTVRISIMSIGSRKKLLPNIVNSQAALGGILSIVNPVDIDDASDMLNDPEVKSEKTSIMSKLKRDRQDKLDQQDDDMDTEIDRLDIDIKIDDVQYVGEGTQKRWQCKICPKSYTTKHNLLAHILDHSSIKPHLCLVCGKYFKQLSHLNTHMLTHDHVKPYKCKVCEKGFTQISHLKRHETVHLESKPYICDICKRGFAFPSELRIHKDKHIFGKEKCTDCDKEFNTVDELKEHMVIEKHGDELTCKHCHRMFKYPSQLRDHMMSHGGARPFICTECGMDFMKEHHLRAHLFTHTGLRPFSCPHCSRSFNQKANMVRHMLIHDSERAFKCEICSKTFTQPQTLKAHMVVHSDKKPYSCRFCGKQFGRQHNLQGHLYIHMDSKPYVCSICQSSFTLKGNLNRHKKVKHGLNESTENMEEDAVNFLSSLSDRTRDVGSPEQDTISQEDASTPDGKSSKKARKSTPKKHITQKAVEDVNGDGEDSNLISYSDEERENEERLSKYFINAGDEDENEGTGNSRAKIALFRKKTVTDGSEMDDENENEAENESEAENENEAEYGNEAGNENEARNKNKVQSLGEEGLDNKLNIHKMGVEKRSTRKRKKKALDDGFLDYDVNLEEEEYVVKEPPKKNAKRKGAMLDTLIAAKFKNL